jgi:hypothetical protein
LGIQRWSPPILAAWIGLLAAIFYSALADFAIPTQRALIMIAVAMGAVISRRHLRWMQVMALALIGVDLMGFSGCHRAGILALIRRGGFDCLHRIWSTAPAQSILVADTYQLGDSCGPGTAVSAVLSADFAGVAHCQPVGRAGVGVFLIPVCLLGRPAVVG